MINRFYLKNMINLVVWFRHAKSQRQINTANPDVRNINTTFLAFLSYHKQNLLVAKCTFYLYLSITCCDIIDKKKYLRKRTVGLFTRRRHSENNVWKNSEQINVVLKNIYLQVLVGRWICFGTFSPFTKVGADFSFFG